MKGGSHWGGPTYTVAIVRMKVAAPGAEWSVCLTLPVLPYMTGKSPARWGVPCEKITLVSYKKLPKHYCSVVYFSDASAVGEGWEQCDAR